MGPTVSEKLRPGDPAPAFRLQPVSGLPVTVGPEGPLSVLLFLRPMSSAHSRAVVTQVQAMNQKFDGIQVVQFTRSLPENINDFVPRHHVLRPIVNDVEGVWYERYGVGRDRNLIRTLLDLPGWSRLPNQLRFGMGRPEGFHDQLSAAFVVGQDGLLRFVWYGNSIFDTPDPELLLQVARSP